jgi:signal transduction histidine kinase
MMKKSPPPRKAESAVAAALRERTAELQQARAALAAERKLAHEAEQRARSTADALREATVALTRSLDRETVLATLLDHLRRLIPFDSASVMLLEEAWRVSVRAVFDGRRVLPLPPADRPEFLATDHPIVHRILTTGAPVLIPDIGAVADWTLPVGSANESWLGVPLFARGSVAGLFSVAKQEARYFNDEHVRVAEALSSQASVAVENAILFEQMQAATERMQTLSRRLVEVQETERRTVARELHDEAGQALVSLRYGLQLLERETGGEGIAARVAELKQTTDSVIDSLHRLAGALRPASLDLVGLEAALRQYLHSTESKWGLTVRFKARGLKDERLPAAVETALYRVVQEAVTNVVRHAAATRIDVLVERRDGRVVVMVEDDGKGFASATAGGAECLGLIGMRERAEALGGTLTIESAPGEGTTIAVEVACGDPHPDR